MVFESLADVPERLIKAYQSNQWSCRVPDGPTTAWHTLEWINWIGIPELERVADKLDRGPLFYLGQKW